MTTQRHLSFTAELAGLLDEIHELGGAECSQVPDVFYPHMTQLRLDAIEVQTAKSICNRCPVRERCLEVALITREPYGIWGGLTPEERTALRR